MNKQKSIIMRKTYRIGFVTLTCLLFIISFFYVQSSSIIMNTITEDKCNIYTKTIINVAKRASNEIVFSDKQGDHYYINHGLDCGLNLDSIKTKVLNKTVTLHLPKLFGGVIMSEYIAQIAIGDDIIFTELN